MSFVHLWIIVINVYVVEDLGMAPNWLFLIFARMAGFARSFTTNSSATLDKSGFSDIDRIDLCWYHLVFFPLEWAECQLFSNSMEGVLCDKSGLKYLRQD